MKQFKKQNTVKSVFAFVLALMLMVTNLTGLVEVKAAGVPAPTISKVFYDAATISGAGVHRARVSGKTVRGIIHVTLKHGDTIKASSVINPTSASWIYTLPENVHIVEGDMVIAYQEFNGQNSSEVTANSEPSLAYNHKNELKMPSGDFYLEQYAARIVNDDERAEAFQMLKDANPSFANDIESIMLEIHEGTIGGTGYKEGYYIITYTDKSKTGEILAPNMKIIPVTEHSRTYTLESYNVVSTVIKGKLDGEGPFDNIKVQFSSKLSEAAKASFCEGGKCTIDKDSNNLETIDVNPQTGEFSINVGEKTLQIGNVLGIKVREPHKFATCNSSIVEIAIPKVDVKDPKKLKPKEKEAIVDAIRKANTTPSGTSKLPDGAGEREGVPAVIQIDDKGNIKIFSAFDAKGDWDNSGKFIPEKNEDGSYKLSSEAKPQITFDKPEKLLKNLPPDTPKMENKDGNVVVTPNIEVDTDAKKVIVEYEGTDGSKKTVTATKGDTGWTVDDSNAKVDENGVVSIFTKEVKPGTKVTASVVDEGGLVPEETALGSDKAELLIENKYKVIYKAGEGSGEMAEEEVEAGKEYTILKSTFTVPTDKEFDYWQIGFEKKKAGEQIVVNNDVEITAVYKYVINPTIDKIITKVNHPINYDMYKNSIKGFPSALKVEHIEVKTKPDISAIGTTEAEIEVRFSDGQFRTLKVAVGVIEDPKNITIKELNDKVDELNNTITEKDGKITELNDKITELENQLKNCQEQCAKDKAQCEKDKQALRDQIAELEKTKSNLEIQLKENRELIEQLRKQIASLEKQVEDWKKIAGEKDTKIKELENSIKDLNTKLDIANTANTELKEKLATATEKITGLESKIRELESKVEELNKKVTELSKTIEAKNAEIKTLNETITTLKENIAKLETEKAKDKEAYDKEKAELERQIQEAKDKLATKEKELGNIKTELEQVKNDLATEKTKTAGLEEQVKSKDEMITKLNKDIEELKSQLAKAKDDNTTVIREKETIIKEKETLIENLTKEKAELEKQLEVEKTKNANLEKQVTDLNTKVDKAAEDLNKANTNISNLEKELAAEKQKNADLTEKINKAEEEIKAKTKEVETLNGTVTDLKEQIAKLETEKAKNKEIYEKDKAALQEKLDKANQDLATKNTELDNIKKELEQAKKDLADEKIKNAGITEKTKADEAKIADLEAQLKELQDKLDKANTDLKVANDKIAELEKQVTEKEAENKTLKDKVVELDGKIKEKDTEINTLTGKVAELEKEITEKTNQETTDKAEIDKLTKDLGEVKKQLEEKNTEVENLNKEVKTLKDNITTLEGEKTELTNKVTELEENVKDLKDKIDTTNNKVTELEKENSELKESNKDLNKKVGNLGEEVGKLKEAKDNLEKLLEKSEEDKTKLQDEKKKLEKDLSELKEDLSKCPADQPKKIKELETKITEKENLIKEKDKDISNKDEIIKELKEKLDYANSKTEELNKKLKDLESKSKTNDNDYIHIKEKYERNQYESYRLEKDYWNLRKENKELLDEIDFLKDKIYELEKNKNNSCNFEKLREKYVTIFNINNFLYQSYIGDEFITQAEMNDSKGYISPFISNGRTMLPMRYVALSLGFDVYWNNHTRTATFVNTGLKNKLDPGRITINADNLNMLNQYGQIINIDSKPIIRNGRFYVSISNIVRAFNGTQGYTNDGINNTIEWNPTARQVLVYKYIK